MPQHRPAPVLGIKKTLVVHGRTKVDERPGAENPLVEPRRAKRQVA